MEYALVGVYIGVQPAVRARAINETDVEALVVYRGIYLNGTLSLATHAFTSVRLSSIKVNGESTGSGIGYPSEDVPVLADPYGIRARSRRAVA